MPRPIRTSAGTTDRISYGTCCVSGVAGDGSGCVICAPFVGITGFGRKDKRLYHHRDRAGFGKHLPDVDEVELGLIDPVD